MLIHFINLYTRHVYYVYSIKSVLYSLRSVYTPKYAITQYYTYYKKTDFIFFLEPLLKFNSNLAHLYNK